MFQTFFYQPVLNLLIFLYNIVPGNDLGVAIILLTVIIKLVLYPLSHKAIKSQKALQELQPKIEEIKRKYKDKREEMGRAMMALYKNNKVNPFSSCLPLLVQLPFLIAVFRVFQNGFENGTLNLVYPFLSRPDSIDYISFGVLNLAEKSFILAILAGIAQFWQSKMMMAKRPEVKSKGSRDEDMMSVMNKQMLYFMPALTVFFAMSFPSGLALYWLATTVFTGLQQLILFKKQKVSEGGNKVIEGEVIK